MSTARPCQRSGRHSRRVSRRVRRNRLIASGLLAVLIGMGYVLLGSGAPPKSTSAALGPRGMSTSGAQHPSPTRLASGTSPRLTSQTLPWSLPAGLSRSVVVPDGRDHIVVLGGLTTTGSSAAGMYSVDLSSGTKIFLGDLVGPLHDAGGAALAGYVMVFGGGTGASVRTVQGVHLPSGGSRSVARRQHVGSSAQADTPGHTGNSAQASVIGELPQPRSDGSVAVIGRTAYVVGGYDGMSADAQVLSTTNGRNFSVVVSLPQPVRYAAVAAMGGKIYVFGGEAVTGPLAGRPVRDVQVIDPTSHTAAIIGQLPEPLKGAAAATLGGHLYVLGGNTLAQDAGAGGVTGPGSPGLATTRAIWGFDTATSRTVLVGELAAPVAHSGVTVDAGRIWLVGGEQAGVPVPTVQDVYPARGR